jgi:hypothetical protein
MRRALLALALALALPAALASGACGTEEWSFYDPTPSVPDEASIDADVAIDSSDAEHAPEAAADGPCDPEASRCPVSCAGGAPCPSNAPVCTEPHDICEPCLSNQDCQTVRSGPICTTSGGCAPECSSDRSCPNNRPHCARSIGRCVRCIDDSDCPVGDACFRYSCGPAQRDP